MKKRVLEQCYKNSIKLLKANSTKHGILASTNTEKAIDKKYDYIFGRDASICSLGMVASGDKTLVDTAKQGLMTLADNQTRLGEIPYSVSPDKKMRLFYYLGTIDSTLWWLYAVDFFERHLDDFGFKKELEPKIKKAIKWLWYQDRNNDGLLEQGEATDWADDMPVNGQALYTNALWYKVLEIYGQPSEKDLVASGIKTLFLPHNINPRRSKYINKNIHRMQSWQIVKEAVEEKQYYLHYISYRSASDRLDVYANLLAILFDVPSPRRSEAILRAMRNSRINKKYPVQVLVPPIMPEDYDWREYMDREDSDNKPFQYHNGGVWPFVGGFWVIALNYLGRQEMAKKELIKLAEANRLNDWSFPEWLDGKKGQPQGMVGQSWNAAMYILATHFLQGEVIL